MTVLSLRARRAATLLSTGALTFGGIALASPALAANGDGSDPGDGLSVLQTVGYFAGIPIGVFLIVAFLVYLPGWLKASRRGTSSTAVVPSGEVTAPSRQASQGPESFGIEPPSV